MADPTQEIAQTIADIMTGITNDRLPGYKWKVYDNAVGGYGVHLPDADLLYDEQYRFLLDTFVAPDTGVRMPFAAPSAEHPQACFFAVGPTQEEAEQQAQWIEKYREPFKQALSGMPPLTAEQLAAQRAAKARKLAEEIARANGTAPATGPDAYEGTLSGGGHNPAGDDPDADEQEFLKVHRAALKKFIEDSRQYRWEPSNPNDPDSPHTAGGKFWIPGDSDKNSPRHAITVAPGGVVHFNVERHPSQSDDEYAVERTKALKDAIRLAVMMHGGNIVAQGETPAFGDEVATLARALFRQGKLTDHEGNVLPDVIINGISVATGQPVSQPVSSGGPRGASGAQKRQPAANPA